MAVIAADMLLLGLQILRFGENAISFWARLPRGVTVGLLGLAILVASGPVAAVAALLGTGFWLWLRRQLRRRARRLAVPAE